jgi:maleate cis-trans isomerase
MKSTKLEAIYSSQKSFSNKAIIIDGTKLQSYSTIVAIKNLTDRTIEINGYYSGTTARHINEFLQQNGLDKLSKKEIEAKPILNY